MSKMSMWFATIRGALPGAEFDVTFVPPDAVNVCSRINHRCIELRLSDVDGKSPASVVDLLRTALGMPDFRPASSTRRHGSVAQ
jgi:hypothetical protein